MSRLDDFRGVDPRALIDRGADWHLSNWAAWTERYSLRIGYSRHSPLLRSDASASFDELVEREDAKSARVCDAVIDSLPPIHRAAIHNVYLLSVFRHRGDPLSVFVEAAEAFWRLAQRRGLK